VREKKSGQRVKEEREERVNGEGEKVAPQFLSIDEIALIIINKKMSHERV